MVGRSPFSCRRPARRKRRPGMTCLARRLSGPSARPETMIVVAAARYFSSSKGESVRTSPMLSNP